MARAAEQRERGGGGGLPRTRANVTVTQPSSHRLKKGERRGVNAREEHKIREECAV